MGHSPTIEELAAQDQKFRDYLATLEKSLRSDAATNTAALEGKVTEHKNSYPDATDLLSGENFDFMHESEFTMDNLHTVINAIAGALFAGTGSKPPGAEVAPDAKDKVKQGVDAGSDNKTDPGAAATAMAGIEVYIAGKVLDILSQVVTAFGTGTTTTVQQDLKSEPLGYGMQLFTAVAAKSYEAHGFFNQEAIHEYIYSYKVSFSLNQAKDEGTQQMVHLYADQIARFTKLLNILMDRIQADVMDNRDATKDQGLYDLYEKALDTAQEKLNALTSAKKAQVLKALR